MEKVLNIEGMSCMHCVKHVTEALKAIEGVTGVEVSLENKSASLTLSKDIDRSVFQEAIDEAGFELV